MTALVVHESHWATPERSRGRGVAARVTPAPPVGIVSV